MAGKGTIGAKLVLEGESQYRTALKGIKSAQSELRSEMKLCSSEFKSSQNSLEALQSKYSILGKQVETARSKYDVYAEALSKAKTTQAQLGDALAQAQSKYDAAAKTMEEMKTSTTATDEELEEQQKLVNQCAQEVNDAQGKYDACSKKVTDYQTSLNYAGAELAEFEGDQKQVGKYLEEAEKSTDKCATSIDEYGKEVQEASAETTSFGTVLSANLASEAILAGVERLVDGIKTVASACIDTGMAFEKSMSTVAALSGATGDDLEALTNKAREMGAATLYSAADAADALGYMALAGWDTQQMLDGIAPVMNLAIASNMDLAEASDIVTDNITAFGLTVADSSKFVDQMAYAMSNSNTNTEQLGEAYKNCAAAAGSMGFSVEDTTAALMVMADAGQKGSEAGTGLKTIMTRLATDSKNCATELSKYGVEVYDAQGNMNSLSSILLGCGEIWEDLTDEEQNNLAVTIAGQNQFNKFQTIMMGMNQAARDSGKSFADYTAALEECDGAAQAMADTMADNLQGAIWNMESGLEAVEETIYSALSDSLQEGVQDAADALERLDNSMKTGDTQVALARLGDELGNFISTSADLVENIMPAMIDGMTWIVSNAGTLSGGVTGMVSALVAYNAATAAAEAITALFNGTLALNPIGAVAALIAGATAALVVWKATAGTTEAEKLAKDTQSLADSLEQSAAARETDRKEMEASKGVISALVDELEDENTTNKRKAQIVKELNTALPELNLAYDEQNDLLSMSTDEIRENADAMIERLKLAAAEEDLTEIIQDQYEAEKQLREIQEEAAEKYGIEADSAEELAEALRKMAEEQSSYNDEWTAYTGMPSNLGDNTDDMLAYAEAIGTAQESIDSLTEEYNGVQEYINQNTDTVNENTDALNENSDAMSSNASAAAEASQEILDAYEDAFESVHKTLEGASEDFQSLGQEALGLKDTTVASFDEIKQSIDEWAAGIDSYADSVAIAEQIMGSDSNSAAYLQSIIDKGPSAAAELDAVTDAYYNNNDAFESLVETYNQANTMLDSLSELEAGFSTKYTAAYDAGMAAITERAPELTSQMESSFTDQMTLVETKTAEIGTALGEGYTSAISDQTSSVAEAATQVAQEGIIDPMDETLGTTGEAASTETTRMGEELDQGLVDGMTNNQTLVVTQAQLLCTEVYSTFETELASSKFVGIGEAICNGMVQGIQNGASWIKTAAANAAKDAYDAAKAALDVHSPSKKFRYLGEMSGEGYMEGLVESMTGVDKVIANSLPDGDTLSATTKAGSGSGRSGAMVNQTVNIYAKTDSIIDTARQFKQSQREAANAW